MTTAYKAFPARPRQHGVVLVFALIALVIMLIGAVAITRSINSAQFNVGNIGFKRDLTNQSERAVQTAMAAVGGSGLLASPVTRLTNLKSANYSATRLATNPQGIPTALLSDTEFANVGQASNDIAVGDLNVTLRYVVDRLATSTGACSPSTCIVANQTVFGGSSSEWINSQSNSGAANNANPSAVPQQPIYRLTVRLTGPRNTLSFFQSTFTSD
jgi:Tfp pilus assembly protein PilX